MKKHTTIPASVQPKSETVNGSKETSERLKREAEQALKFELKNVRKKIFQETLKDCIILRWNRVTSSKHENEDVKKPVSKHQPIIKIVDADCMEIALQLSQQGKTCMLNMANAISRGGGVKNGAMAQEEELCRRSNLWYGLKKSYYPMTELQFSYQKNVKFFKDSSYNWLDTAFKCDIITIAAPCLINTNVWEYPNYCQVFEEKIKQALWFPAQMGAKNLVLSALGCGAFRNNPIFVAKLFKKYLKNLPYENITFAILDDKNSKNNGVSNYQSFKKIL